MDEVLGGGLETGCITEVRPPLLTPPPANPPGLPRRAVTGCSTAAPCCKRVGGWGCAPCSVPEADARGSFELAAQC
jgi:hypothetical protein